MAKNLNLLITANATSMHTVVGQLINLVLHPIYDVNYYELLEKVPELKKESKVLYIERSDLDYLELEATEENKEIKNQLLFLDHLEVSEVGDMVDVFKGHDHQVTEKINKYIKTLCKICKDNGYTLRFWTVNPLDWSFFLNNGFYFINGTPQLFEGMDPYPVEVNVLSNTLTLTEDYELEFEKACREIFSESVYTDDLLTLSARVATSIKIISAMV